jgi:hypothetical protein
MLAVGAVRCEPLSPVSFPISGKFAGNLRKNWRPGPPQLRVVPGVARFADGVGSLRLQTEQGNFAGRAGTFFGLLQGNHWVRFRIARTTGLRRRNVTCEYQPATLNRPSMHRNRRPTAATRIQVGQDRPPSGIRQCGKRPWVIARPNQRRRRVNHAAWSGSRRLRAWP